MCHLVERRIESTIVFTAKIDDVKSVLAQFCIEVHTLHLRMQLQSLPNNITRNIRGLQLPRIRHGLPMNEHLQSWELIYVVNLADVIRHGIDLRYHQVLLLENLCCLRIYGG